MSQNFAPGGAGASISALVGVAVGGAFISMVLSSIGQGLASQLTKIMTTLACIGIVVAAVAKTLSTLGISL
jgi:formiminotetrahydrofolate cyclodeaminase